MRLIDWDSYLCWQGLATLSHLHRQGFHAGAWEREKKIMIICYSDPFDVRRNKFIYGIRK
ncbi:hypothetical protein THIOM_004323 [Candidatus Thiomargarita nelsonii]|uniref:Uncharacterized protein n=1 Tax=Candidatus Thiomargarita nelsonii TaxID=1003181 RepID=A0A176RW91_9GAMM|nr:hypothetical protein THIOM_004323 [Candidatus Thiomargarita nelsonii]